MTTSNRVTVLKDVVAYVDVWASDKRANYSKPFIQQLQEMGAQVSKTFNKQVTHVVFNNGHPAAWIKAKKSNVKLVSVLWIGRCYEDGVHVDEELYPASNDDSNPVLKNKKHRCMQPRDSPERTPENDRRMKRKLDKMMKDMAPKQPSVTDVSPIIIDEVNGIVYSPSCKRADYMAERLKRMKEKHESISPTASQMMESSSLSGPKPSLGNSPTVFKFLYDNSDDDSTASVAELSHSPDKEKVCEESDTTEDKQHDKYLTKDFEKPWLSPCSAISKPTFISPLKCLDFEENEVEGTSQTNQMSSSIRKNPTGKAKSVGVIQGTVEEVASADGREAGKDKSHTKSCSPVAKPLEQSDDKSEKGRRNIQVTKPVIETKANCPDDVNSSGFLLAPTILGHDTLFNDHSLLQKRRTRGKTSLSALSLSSESQKVASSSPVVKDDVFEDFFSSTNHKIPNKPLLPVMPDKRDLHISFEMDSFPKKRKQRRSKRAATATNNSKKRKVEETGDRCSQQAVANTERKSPPQKDVKESLPALDPSNATLATKQRRQSTLPFVRTSGGAAKRLSASVQPPKLMEAKTSLELQNHSDCQLSHTFQSRRREHEAAAALTELPNAGWVNQNKHTCSSHQKIDKVKSFRTLVMTSMPTEKQHLVVQVVKALGGFSITNRVCKSTTHVVSGQHRRTLNVLLGIARGCWILSFEWILWCLEQRQWLPEEPYELSEVFPAAQICRLQRHLSAGVHQQDLFQDQPTMFVSQHSQPPAPSLVELIQLCGGTVCKTVRQAGICIGKYSGRRPEGSRILSEQQHHTSEATFL
ncbi:microcephalin isoform X2 [Dunckerocampus dactyliophorus]|uniref:microcephalin isoform X2 n=1 Tax=Dunckerocampus dactyliophorus TaxID=161453 RepID=UPI00240722FD|nr:microcephalin isoform X2 [Dunckerocampus dactyliophorus]